MKISVVTSIYYSQGYINEFYDRISEAAKKITSDYELIFVSDGKTDSCTDTIKETLTKDSKVKLIELSRNFGAAAARWEGLKHATGEYIFVLDADLEENPELLNTFYSKLGNTESTDVVFGYIERRKGGLIEKFSGWVFYRSFEFWTGIKMIGSPVWVRLMKRNYVNALLKYGEQHLFAIGIMKLVGFNQIGIPIEKKSKGYSSYSLTKKVSQTFDSIISFSDRPLRMISLGGVLTSVIALLFITYLAYSKIFLNEYMAGWTSLIASVFLVGGLNMAAIGIVGLYVGKTFQQSKNRPRAIVKKTYNFE
tara:strand:- start:2285 stop:3208 length:924 start_codon:yes stop_codon:yes gene_type:complete